MTGSAAEPSDPGMHPSCPMLTAPVLKMTTASTGPLPGRAGKWPSRPGAAAAEQPVGDQLDEGALDDRQLAVVVLPAGPGGQPLVQPLPGRGPGCGGPGLRCPGLPDLSGCLLDPAGPRRRV